MYKILAVYEGRVIGEVVPSNISLGFMAEIKKQNKGLRYIMKEVK